MEERREGGRRNSIRAMCGRRLSVLFALKPEPILNPTKEDTRTRCKRIGYYRITIPRFWVWASSESPNPLLTPRRERIPSHVGRRQRKSVDRRLCTVGKQSSPLSRLLIAAAATEAELWPLVMVRDIVSTLPFVLR